MTATLEPTDRALATTIASRVRDRAQSLPTGVAMRSKKLGIWAEVSWSEYWSTILDVGHALLALGVEPGDRVAIQADNREEWLFVDLATVAVRGATVGLYPTNPAPEVGYLLADSGATVHFAADQEQLDKAMAVLSQTPDMQRIVYLDPRGIRQRYDDPRLMSWEQLLDLGREHRAAHPGAVEQRMAEAAPDDLMTLVYTSGTTGPPKGAMLSVANVEYAIGVFLRPDAGIQPTPSTSDISLSYLPLCHVAERLFTVWLNSAAGVQVNFAESIETVPANLREVQPTLLFGVPRIWEKLLASVSIRRSSASRFKRSVFAVGMRLSQRIGATLAANGGRHTPATRLMYAVGWLLLFRALRDRLGMRKVRYAASAAAPIAPDVLQYFMGLGVPMVELYGMTENTAAATANVPGRVKLGTVGEAQEGVEVRIDEQTGEILTRSPATFMGYWRQPEATARVIDSDGWLHTGDVGEWVDGTHLKITDRMKDIIITSGGKNIAPSEIENALKVSPYIKEAVVIGDRRAYLTALIGIELDTVSNWAQKRRLSYTTYRDLSEKKEVLDLVQGIVNDVNERFATVEQIKRFRMLPKELDHEDGELTATQKVKRSALAEAFGPLVESMYGAAEAIPAAEARGTAEAIPAAEARGTAEAIPAAEARGTAEAIPAAEAQGTAEAIPAAEAQGTGRQDAPA